MLRLPPNVIILGGPRGFWEMTRSWLVNHGMVHLGFQLDWIFNQREELLENFINQIIWSGKIQSECGWYLPVGSLGERGLEGQAFLFAWLPSPLTCGSSSPTSVAQAAAAAFAILPWCQNLASIADWRLGSACPLWRQLLWEYPDMYRVCRSEKHPRSLFCRSSEEPGVKQE